jgi:hypothetical protein
LIDQDLGEELLAGLPPIRWPDPADPAAELIAAVLLASPVAADQFLATRAVVFEHARSLHDRVRLLFEAGAYCGGRGAPEVAGLLWDEADRVRAEVER